MQDPVKPPASAFHQDEKAVHAVLLEHACQLTFKQLDTSPFVAKTGEWQACS